ncbi:MAG: tRNA (guanosine(46)-N7)-methyltransferase TrmB [Synergistaceae bacterium]|nr:tRNA (guanosine(46)-N7)-methyltransferase TrmB [Synergistota bacterium]NLM70918.1 tRNA (guanosine(46)-N7)-methyltransferase TrmB [Synergistaceae bacterium]
MIDASGIIILPERESLPLDLARGRAGVPVFLELGFGNGEYLLHLAREDRDAIFWGAEMSRSCVLRALKRVVKEGTENVFLVCCDARFFLKECLPRGSLDGIFMNFPCPWPKKRHTKRRLSGEGFPSRISGALGADGFFELMTDEEWFALEVRDSFAEESTFFPVEWDENPPRPVTTKYERKWTEMGKSLYRLRFVKREEEGVKTPPRLGRSEDLHILVPGCGPLSDLMKSLYNLEGKTEDSLWVLKKTYSSGKGGEHLVEAVCTDGGFEQKFFLMLVEREDDVLVKVAPYSSPYLTGSVKGAIRGLASAVERHCSGASAGPDGETNP